MASVLNRTTKQYLKSVNTNDYSVLDWIINPDLSGVVGFDSKYWLISGDAVSLMSQAERDGVDTQEQDAIKDGEAGRLQVSGFDRAFAEIMMDEINILRNLAGLQPRTLLQLKSALRSKL